MMNYLKGELQGKSIPSSKNEKVLCTLTPRDTQHSLKKQNTNNQNMFQVKVQLFRKDAADTDEMTCILENGSNDREDW